MTFLHVPAPPDLRPWVSGFGERSDRDALGLVRELPMARAAIQVMMGGDYHVGGDGPAPRMGLWGPVLEPSMAWTSSPARVFIVFLTSAGAVRLSQVDLVHLVGRRIDLSAFEGDADSRLARPVTQASSFADRQRIACDWLRKRLARSPDRCSASVRLSDRIVSGAFCGSVQDLALEAGLTTRGLSKAFSRELGYSPKKILRLARLERVLSGVHPRPWTGKCDADPLLEFHDQAHLDRDFAKLTGLSRCDYVSAKRASGDGLVFTVI